MKKVSIYLLLFLILFNPIMAYGEENHKTVIFILDEISFKDIEDLKIDKYAIGFLNTKTRKPNDEVAYLTSMNIGRKTNLKDLRQDKIEANFLGDIFKGKIAYLGERDSNLRYLVMDSKFQGENINVESSLKNLEKSLEDKNLIVMNYSLDSGKSIEELSKYIVDKDYKFYIIPKKLDKEDTTIVSRWLVPIITNKLDGILTSAGTKREGLISIEDIVVDIKSNYNIDKNSKDIGEVFQVVERANKLDYIKDFHSKTENLLVISYFLHGIMYFAQAFLCLSLYLDRFKKEALKTFVFATNNIILSLILSMTVYINNFFIYFGLILTMNLLMTRSVFKNINSFKFLSIATYILLVVGMIFKPSIIYNSYVGFNNLMYGVRFYGFNNAMAGVLLGVSILIMAIIDEGQLNFMPKKILILIVGILNTLILSTKYGANTGGFITSILLLFISSYIYIFPRKFNYKSLLYLVILGIIIFGSNLYIDSLDNTKSHALNFILRLRENGMKEFFYMAGFKLRELIKFTLMPPFSIVIVSQMLVIKKLYRKSQAFKLLLYTSILGYLINDTGNVLLIYMLNYGIFILIYRRIQEKRHNFNNIIGGINDKTIY